MTLRPHALLPVVLFGVLFAPAHAEAALKVTGKPRVAFYAKGTPGALDIEGKGSVLTLADDGAALTFTVPWDSVSTGIDLRDNHMKNNYLHVAQHPAAVLVIPKAEVKLPADTTTGTNGTVSGQFTAHGITRPVEVAYDIKLTKVGYRVVGRFNYDISQHGVDIPSYLGITVDAAQRAEVVFDMVDG